MDQVIAIAGDDQTRDDRVQMVEILHHTNIAGRGVNTHGLCAQPEIRVECPSENIGHYLHDGGTRRYDVDCDRDCPADYGKADEVKQNDLGDMNGTLYERDGQCLSFCFEHDGRCSYSL
jgi:hypothetical protein